MRNAAYLLLFGALVCLVLSAFLLATLEQKAQAPAQSTAGQPHFAAFSSPEASGQTVYTPQSFDLVARRLFANVYRLLARQIYGDYGIDEGVCIDVGSGPCYLSIELAKITHLRFFALDIDPAVMPIAIRNVKEAGLLPRFSFVLGDVEQMPFRDDFADLIVSRGSYLFWKDKVSAFREIYRVLKPGGIAFVGGGMGRLLPEEERQAIFKEMARLKFGPQYWGVFPPPLPKMRQILHQAGISSYRIFRNPAPCKMWIEIRK